jgi:hypothetical protein
VDRAPAVAGRMSSPIVCSHCAGLTWVHVRDPNCTHSTGNCPCGPVEIPCAACSESGNEPCETCGNDAVAFIDSAALCSACAWKALAA